jgi:hypothetical protein
VPEQGLTVLAHFVDLLVVGQCGFRELHVVDSEVLSPAFAGEMTA